jgi:hypothetical protein
MNRLYPPVRPTSPSRRPGRLLAAAVALAMATAAVGADVKPFDNQRIGATLTYTIEINGKAHTENARDTVWSKDDVQRKLQGTLHLRGERDTYAQLDNAQEQIDRLAPARQAMAPDMPAMEKIMEECGEDEACATARMTALVNRMSPERRNALASATRGPAAKFSQHAIGAWSLDGKLACLLQATSTGSSSYRTVDAGEGYVEYFTGSEERHGESRNDCRHDPLPSASAQWHGDTGLLDISLPGLALDEQWKSGDGKTGSRKVVIPGIKLEHLHWSGKGPQSGQQTRKVTTGARDGSIPATMTIRWTFTPHQA